MTHGDLWWFATFCENSAFFMIVPRFFLVISTWFKQLLKHFYKVSNSLPSYICIYIYIVYVTAISPTIRWCSATRKPQRHRCCCCWRSGMVTDCWAWWCWTSVAKRWRWNEALGKEDLVAFWDTSDGWWWVIVDYTRIRGSKSTLHSHWELW